MRRHRVMLVLAGAAAVWWTAPPAVMAAPAGGAVARAGTWRKAIEVPGLGALNAGGDAGVSSVSCGSAGNCVAGGFYLDSPRVQNGDYQAFVVSERNGTWRKAIKVPGSGMLNKGDARVDSVSCASAGNCAAGGTYNDGSGHTEAFVVSERNGTWRTAIEVPGSGALNAGGYARVHSVSCPWAGNCAAGGFYTDGSGHPQAFVVSERNGTWRTAIEVPGSGALNAGGGAGVSSVSCASAGNCAAAGSYNDGSPVSGTHRQAFVVSERNGTWRTAIEVPGSGRLNKGAQGSAESVSCASAGNCAAGGTYNDGSGHQQAFVVSENNGTWRTAIEVPGSGALNTGGCPLRCAQGGVSSVSCASAGNCAAGGFYTDLFGRIQAFVVSQA
jgi:hypothetical protein